MLVRLFDRWTGFVRSLFQVIVQGELFFWAGAISFNALVAFVPLMLLVAGVSGFALSAGEPLPRLIGVLTSYLPAFGAEVPVRETVQAVLEGVIEERAPLSLIGGLFLLWISTRLVTCLRIVLREIFHVPADRGIIRGKLFDFSVVAFGGLLVLVNLGLTVAVEALETIGSNAVGLGVSLAVLAQTVTGRVLGLISAWTLFLLLYWRLPPRRIPFRSVAVGATFAAVGYETLKEGFAWYATSVADYSSAYGSLGIVAVLFFWIYYSAVVFVLGGQVARVHELRREAR